MMRTFSLVAGLLLLAGCDNQPKSANPQGAALANDSPVTVYDCASSLCVDNADSLIKWDPHDFRSHWIAADNYKVVSVLGPDDRGNPNKIPYPIAADQAWTLTSSGGDVLGGDAGSSTINIRYTDTNLNYTPSEDVHTGAKLGAAKLLIGGASNSPCGVLTTCSLTICFCNGGNCTDAALCKR